MNITRQEAINEAGIKAVEIIENDNLDFSNRVTDGTKDHGNTEFSVSTNFIDSNGEECQLFMYCFINSDDVQAVESLDLLDWETAIKNAEFEII